MLKLRTMVAGAEHIGAGLWVDEDDPRITRVGALLRRTSLDELPNLWNVLRGEMSLIGPRPTVPEQVAQYTERQRGRLAIRPGITGWAQVNGRAALPWERADRARPLLHRAPLAGARPADPVAHRRDGPRRLRPVQGPGRRLEGRAVSAPARPADGRGQALDIVSCFAHLTRTVAADPIPLAPAQYAAHVRASVPLIDDPGYVPALERLCEEHGVGAVLPLTDLDIEVLAARPRRRAAARARARPPRSPGRPTTSTRPTCCCSALSLPSPPTVLPEDDLDAIDYPVMVKPRRGSGARSIHLAARRVAGALLRRLRARAGDGPAGDGRPGALDRLPRRSRRPLPERDPAHDARVPRRRVDQGPGDPRRRADRAGPPRDGGAGRVRPGDDPGLPRPRASGWRSPT